MAPYAVALAAQLIFLGYMKDDAYIEYRYATNAAHGHGLTFNVGDAPVEGFTSFLWTVFLIVPAWLHLPMLAFAKLAGAAALVGCIVVTARLVGARGGDERAVQVARWLVATNASLLVWAQSGMETVQTAFVVVAAVYFLELRRHWPAMLLAAAAALLRPECHLVLFLVGAVVVWRRAPLPVLVALLAVGAVHYWRWRYFGGLLPNTALVKSGRLIWRHGLRQLGELMVSSLAGICIALTIVEAWRKRDAVAVISAAAVLLFCVYLVRIGKDEMFLMRLFIPVWPLALAMAAERLARGWRFLPVAVCIAGILWLGPRLPTVGYWLLGERSHVPLAQLMKKHARPGDVVIFQDLGQTPWAAMELRFVDPIGLVDSVIGHVRYREHSSPFSMALTEKGQAEVVDHLFALDPKLIAFVAYPEQYAADVRRSADAARTPAELAAVFEPFVLRNPYYCGLYDDGRFRARFRFVDVIRRKDNYWFVLYERI
ncbi:MAG: hypothetical protein JWN44_6081 [Myxococcales bacterium]|nr:hypothetical protein [Myxococcales bacterium]